ncbi:hypothetical protein AWB79_06159 [Caballeronia hypogeia]|uniref:DUF4239 domain-containing protein n=1 Tax=Caballeronia hypogeia TaxID=1777140 RepID=A0A158CZU2_9BURK|nr:hypothetical protein [Caballeronia hypogeia]SAK87117.1 hypothetical protein AWB79_06159 [Caballeronia hypogeia]
MAGFIAHPAALFPALLACFIAAVAFGAIVLRRLLKLPDEEREDFNVVQTATLTLLALLIGFTLSMAVGRYDQRKTLEEAEANAIGTEYARADLVGAPLGVRMKSALVDYAKLRSAYYSTGDRDELAQLSRNISTLQTQLWSLATQVAKDTPTPIGAIVVTGMNDVLNSQDYAEAARINHIPLGAWFLMIVIGLFACAVQGFGARGKLGKGWLITVLPVTVSLSFSLISDIDSPQGGFIRVQPQNLNRLLQSFPS